MIQLKISGRAGNQFFQYAFVDSFALDNNIHEKIYISFEHLKNHNTDKVSFKNELDNFKINNIELVDKVKYNMIQKFYDFIYKVCIKIIRMNARLKKRNLNKKDYQFIVNFLQKRMNQNGLYYYIPGMKTFYKSKSKNLIFFGCYEDNSYYIKNRNELINKFEPKYEIIDSNKALYDKIINTNSVCITIRRGDFLNPNIIDDYYICNKDYFEKSINRLNELVEKPQYIVFSDDIEWCKNNIDFPENTLFESGVDPIWEKIRLMSSCKHFIISNSTFSWWAQYLSKNKNKIVIAPKKWNNFEYAELIYDKNWILN